MVKHFCISRGITMDEAKKAKEEAINYCEDQTDSSHNMGDAYIRAIDLAQKPLLDIIEQQKKEIERLQSFEPLADADAKALMSTYDLIYEKDIRIKELEANELLKIADWMKTHNKYIDELEKENKSQIERAERNYGYYIDTEKELSLYKEAIDKINHWMQTDDWLKKLISMKILNVKNLSVKSYEEIEKLISALRKSDEKGKIDSMHESRQKESLAKGDTCRNPLDSSDSQESKKVKK